MVVEMVTQRNTFLDLPAELKNTICEQVLVHKRPIKISLGQSERQCRALLDVCRQLKSEYSRLYYSANTFTHVCWEKDLTGSMRSTTSLISWLQRIGPVNRSSLRELQIRTPSRGKDIETVDLFSFVRDQNARILREVGWIPLSVLRVRLDEQWLDQCELEARIILKKYEEEIVALYQHGTNPRKGPDIRFWKSDVYDPVVDASVVEGDRRLSEWVCPAIWRYYAYPTETMTEDEVKEEPRRKRASMAKGWWRKRFYGRLRELTKGLRQWPQTVLTRQRKRGASACKA